MGPPAHVALPTDDPCPSPRSHAVDVTFPASSPEKSPGAIPESHHAGGTQAYLSSPRDADVDKEAKKAFTGSARSAHAGHVASMEADAEFGTVSVTPFPDIKMARTRSNARPGDVIVGYQMTDADLGCFCCTTLTPTGWILVILLSLLFFPAAFIICFLPQFHETVQRPIYGPPTPPPAEWMEKARPHYIPEQSYV